MNEMKPGFYGLLLAGVLCASFSQVLLKKGAMRTWPSFLRQYLNPWVAGGYFLLLGSTALNIAGLRGLSFMKRPGDGSLRICIRPFSEPAVLWRADHENGNLQVWAVFWPGC